MQQQHTNPLNVQWNKPTHRKCQDLEPSFVPNFAWSNLNWRWRNVGFLLSFARNGKAKKMGECPKNG